MTSRRYKAKATLSLILFVLPAFVLYLLFLVIPMLQGSYYSFTDWNGLNKTYDFVGIQNFVEALRDDRYFRSAIWFTAKYVIFAVVFQNVLALLLAMLIESRTRGKGLFRTIFFMPNMISVIISTFMWVFVFSKVIPALSEYAVFKFLDLSWLGDPQVSFWSILLVSLWGGVGTLMLIYMSAIQGIPSHLKEAAIIDGATPFRMLRYITLPLIAHALTICIFLTLNSSFKVYDLVYALTGGGPGRGTQVITMNILEEAYQGNNRYGYASAKAIILFLIILVITMIQVSVMKKREVEA
ncbi:carbohydrate ABC transporter membrane protein 1 (CUT1 family) [Paenibacillus sp. BK033]|uniref:carbohydrate ABC transporter permease n=1 Tax=Paenibacillus sp. BK033 TaxID=2512133 RepID=UPI0010486C8D|nr:sugar ABC transporter permease [Paenibacillus sp. BK033]TCM99093.1 carbohydrate ABC transporter membrane protein 1 (CUT1 family) [Paenibacillus sp. BK033]